jgi:hypothetical protein
VEQTRRDSRILLAMAGLITAGAIVGVIIDRVSETNQSRPTALVVPTTRRVIPWSTAKATASPAASVNWPTLVSGAAAPESVYAGGTLRYRVTLRNNGPDPVALRPCPSFEGSLSPLSGGGVIHSRGLIDCDSIGVLRPEEEVVLEMRIDVPKTFGAGPVNLFWKMDGGLNTMTSLEVLASD